MLARTQPRYDPLAAAALAVALIGVATMLGVFYFQYGLGLKPCPLCLQERYAFYVAIPLALVIASASSARLPRSVRVLGLAVIAVMMLGNAALGGYHSGVEWKLWPGPQECSGSIQSFGRASDLFKGLSSAHVVRCDEAPWRFLGVSLAGYNVVISLALAGISIWGAAATFRGRDGL